MSRGQNIMLTLLHFSLLRDFLQWQVVTGMEAEQIIESLENYIWFLGVPNVPCAFVASKICIFGYT